MSDEIRRPLPRTLDVDALTEAVCRRHHGPRSVPTPELRRLVENVLLELARDRWVSLEMSPKVVTNPD